MPQAIPAVAAWAAAAWSSAVTVTSVALAKVGFVAAIGEGATIALAGSILKTAALTGLSAAATALLRPNTPSSGTALDFKPDPKAPVRGLMGYHATGGNKVFQATWGYNGVAMSLGVALSLGPIDAITRFEADGALVSFTGSQNEAVGFYGDDMWQKTTLGLPTDAALLPPTGLKYQNPSLTGWGSQNAAKGVAFAFWTMVLAKNPEDRDIFVNGVPDPRWIGRWMKLYDWRKDSTYPGGSGAHREDDWRTWEWTENPYLHARAWLRGHFKLNDDGSIDRTRRIAGVGVPSSAIDMAAFTEAANIAATNQWKISGEWSTSDNKWQVLAGMMQAGSGVPINRGAQVSVMVNTPRVSTYTYTRDDMVGQAVVRPLVRRRDRKNTVIPRYRSEQHKWEYVGAGEVTSSVYRDEDRGEPRTTEVQYTFVRDAKQAGQLAAYDLVNMREGLTVTLPSKVHLMHVHAGDCITVNVPEMALANQKVIVMRTTTDYKGAVTTLECRSETDGKHAFALGQAANPPPSPSLSAVDPNYIPPPLPVDVVVIPKPPSNGTSQPIIEVEIPVDRGDIAATVVEFALTSTGPWTSAGPADPSTGKYTLSGLSPNQEYWISVRYVANNGTISERYVTGPHIAPGFVADTINRFPDGTAPIWNYPTFADIPNPPLNDEIVAYVEDEGKLYRWDATNGVWTASVAASDIDGVVPSGIDFGPILPATGGYDKLFLNTTNKKLYRWDGTGWTTAADGEDLVANSITTNKIASGSITTALLGAKAITVDKLAVINTETLIPNGIFESDIDGQPPLGWSRISRESSSDIIVQSDNGWPSRRTVLFRRSATYTGEISALSSLSELVFDQGSVLANTGDEFYVECWCYQNAANTCQIDILGVNPDGTINQEFTTTSQNAQTSVTASISTVGPIVNSWVKMQFTFRYNRGMNPSKTFMRFSNAGPVSTNAYFGGIIWRRRNSSSLLVDGSVVTNKLAANAVTADKITAGAVTAAKINVTELSAISANMGTITAGLIRSGTSGQRTEIDPNGGRSYYANGQLAVRWGVWT